MPTTQRADRLVYEIEAAIRSGNREVQSRLVQESAEMLVKRWSRLPIASKASFDGLLMVLLGQVDASARRLFALKLAGLRLPPPKTVAMLARDPTVEVATPLLSDSRALDGDLLVAAVETCSDDHSLAVAARRDLDTRITDALIARRGAAVAVALLDNPAAPLSETGFDGMTGLAASSEAVAVGLGARDGLPGRCRERLLALARQRADDALDQAWGEDDPRAAAVLEGVPTIFARTLDPAMLARFAASAEAAAEELAPSVATGGRLERWLSLRRIEDVLAALAFQSSLPIAAAVRAYGAPDALGLCVILRGLEHPWSLLKGLLLYRHGKDVPVEALREGYDLFEALTPLAARRLTRFALLPHGHAAFAGAPSRWPELSEIPRDP